jgi:DNA polymerase III subunit beta
MKIECLKENLIVALQKTEKLTSKSSPLNVLKYVLLESTDKSLILKATNMDIGIEYTFPVKTSSSGRIAIPGNVVLSLISQFGNEKSLNLEEIDGNLKVLIGKNDSIIKCVNSDDFPSIPKVDENASKRLKIDSRDMVDGLKAVWYSCANSNIKPELSSVRIFPKDNHLVFVATDGFRLAEKKIKSDQNLDFNHVLIPTRNVSEIVRIFDGLEGDIDVFIDDNQVAFKNGNIYLVSRTVDGNFPDYNAIIPKTSTSEVSVLKQDLVNSLKISTIFSDSFFHVNFSIKPSENKVVLSTKNNEIGENSIDVPASISGEELNINFNYKYINDCIPSINSDSIKLIFNGPGKPLVIKPSSDDSFLYLMMPMNK